jgi:tetratricopeptide (TPR) repeat protein
MRVPLALLAFVLTAGPIAARAAETCPDVPDDEVALRRSLAKEWFAKAEEAEAGGDKQAAIRRYACSLSLAPHPSTAYNLGTVAEKSGDLSMALDGFRTYLKLAPEATDRPAIEARLAAIEARISELRKDIAPKAAPPPAPAPPPPAPVASAPPPAPLPVAAPVDLGAPARGRRTAGLVTGGGAVVVLGVGLALNLMARSRMDTCYSQWNATMSPTALDHCDDAKPLAYSSYALFAVGGAAAIVGGALLLSSAEPAGASPPESAADLTLAPTVVPGGGGLVASGRF